MRVRNGFASDRRNAGAVLGAALRDERGAVAVYIGVITAVLIGFAGLAPEHRAAVPAAPLPGDKTDVLLAALRNSATGCDQIMQRRIGMEGKDS